MAQTIIVITIISLAVIAAGIKLYMFFKSPSSSDCGPDRCASCPYNTSAGSCSESNKTKE
ncbi:MAG: hypothetical protein A2176_04420 [Spirochaetes bacterium RBG_13_51_14]|nr:MAG: hypothetical protein A2176_04420 [Spirochaetes bacterium RBG_13_51_14]